MLHFQILEFTTANLFDRPSTYFCVRRQLMDTGFFLVNLGDGKSAVRPIVSVPKILNERGADSSPFRPLMIRLIDPSSDRPH